MAQVHVPEQQLHIDPYERRWLIMIVVMLGVFFASLIAGALIYGVVPAGEGGFINPQRLDETMFASPGLRDMGNNHYDLVLLAQMWNWNGNPNYEVRLPVGAEVEFYVTSRDVTHGMLIEGHNINFEVIPGHIARAHLTFTKAGEYRLLCHEYCGRLHQAMHATIIVEAAPSAEGTS
ncbi:MAG: hypothetical protein ACOYL5_12950 [Phototrophicaceae bacterium]|jgi:cytochrome c oxidase subunit 2